MTDSKPKIVVIETAGLPTAELAKLLGDRFDVVVGVPSEARTTGASAHAAGPSPLDQPSATDAWLVLSVVADGVALIAPDGEPDFANRAFTALGDEDRAAIAAEAAAAIRQWSAPGAPAPTPVRRELGPRADHRWYDLALHPVRGDGWRAAVVVRDITAARRMQQMVAAIDQAGRDLCRMDSDTVRRLNAAERLRLLEEKTVRAAHDLLHFDHFAVRLLDERTGRLELVMSAGLPPEAAELDIMPSVEGNGIAGYVAATGRGQVCTDSQQDDRFLPLLAGARSSVVVPLRLHQRVHGVLDAESLQPGAFTEDDRQFAEIFARYVALALHMLDLLVVERSATNETVSGRVEGELSEPLADIVREVEALARAAEGSAEITRRVERIRGDVEAIRRRVHEVASGPQTLLGVDRAMADRRVEPLLVGRRVLIADDEPKMRRLIGDVLRHRGCAVTACDSGESAIARLREAASGAIPPFDIVLSDIKMPDRNGYEVFSAARREQPGVPVVLMTGFGYDPHHSIVRASQEGLQSVLFKPFQVERLLDEVRKAIGGRPAGA